MFQNLGTKSPGEWLQGTNKIAFNMLRIKNILDFAFTIGHEMLHLYDVVSGNYLKIRNSMGMTSTTANAALLFMEYRSYSWELKMGNQDVQPWEMVEGYSKIYRKEVALETLNVNFHSIMRLKLKNPWE